jgi:hypothetical protein
MTPLQMIGFIIGGLAAFTGVMMMLKPQAMLKGMEAFPRSKYPAWALALINTLWASWLCTQMYLGWFDAYKSVFFILGAITLIALVKFLDELLAPRMLGALLLLAAAPILKIARFFPSPIDPSPWRIMISILCYTWIAYGLYLLCCPWGFRRLNEKWLKFDPTLKFGAVMKLIAGIVIIVISALFYGK